MSCLPLAELKVSVYAQIYVHIVAYRRAFFRSVGVRQLALVAVESDRNCLQEQRQNEESAGQGQQQQQQLKEKEEKEKEKEKEKESGGVKTVTIMDDGAEPEREASSGVARRLQLLTARMEEYWPAIVSDKEMENGAGAIAPFFRETRQI